MRFYDSHNHLQDEALAPYQSELITSLKAEHVAALVVNGTRETDWPRVRHLADAYPHVVPSFGLHPWYVRDRSPGWLEQLTFYLNQTPAGIGEIGLDRWIENPDVAAQEIVFRRQLQIAAQRNLPVTIHCLRAWGRLVEILKAEPRPECGFLLHSYGGSAELIRPLAELGAYFSISGYFAHERKERQRDVFRQVPSDRLLIETDAPDMLPPETLRPFSLGGANTEKAPNHPANITAIYRFAAELRGQSLDELAQMVETNFNRLFGSIRRPTG